MEVINKQSRTGIERSLGRFSEPNWEDSSPEDSPSGNSEELLWRSRVFSTVFFFKFYLFSYGCVGSSFLCGGFLQLWQVGAALHRGARASHYRGLSCCGAQAPDAQAQ